MERNRKRKKKIKDYRIVLKNYFSRIGFRVESGSRVTLDAVSTCKNFEIFSQ